MVETEIKLRVDSAAGALDALRKAGFRVARKRTLEINIVVDTADAALRQSGRLLRLREAGGIVTITFKGPGRPGRHKSREEHEVTASGLPGATSIFAGLGYHQTFRYEKYRTELSEPTHTGHALVDETPIGTFMELEGRGAWIDKTARVLGYSRRHYITLSYGALYFEDCERRGIVPGNMVFA